MEVLMFVLELYVAVAIWLMALKPPLVLFVAPAMLIGIYYVVAKIFIDWPSDYRVWKCGGIGRSRFSTETPFQRKHQ